MIAKVRRRAFSSVRVLIKSLKLLPGSGHRWQGVALRQYWRRYDERVALCQLALHFRVGSTGL
jgi:hypothetical protein